MSAKSCGCTTETCGCCEGTQVAVPVTIYNRPGLDAIEYRAGTHGLFLETMKARLGNAGISTLAADGTTVQTVFPLSGLTTRDPSDPAIALLDAWSTVGDVLTFYQERIANEGYLRTATERRSVLELARLVGYTLRPGVASTVYLAYTLDDKQAVPVNIPVGAQSQSIPGPGQSPQFFETSDPIETRREWNNLQVRLTKPQDVTQDDAFDFPQLYVSGTSNNIKSGDSLLFSFSADAQTAVLRKIAQVETDFTNQRTLIQLQVPSPTIANAFRALVTFLGAIEGLTTAPAEADNAKRIVALVGRFVTQARLGVPVDIEFWLILLGDPSPATITEFVPAFAAFLTAIGKKVSPPPPPPPTSPNEFIPRLLIPPVEQFRSSFHLPRDLATAFQPKSDVHPSMLIKFAPKLQDALYTAWSGANVGVANRALYAVYVFRVEAPVFGAGVPNLATYTDKQINTPDKWIQMPIAVDESFSDSTKTLYLDQAYEAILPGNVVLLDQSGTRSVMIPTQVQSLQRAAYGISGKSTRLTFADPWRGVVTVLDQIRGTLVFAQSEELSLIEQPVTDDVKGTQIELDELYNGLTSGRWIVLTGERSDIPGVNGVTGTELLMVSGLSQDATIPGDATHTTLLLATTTAYSYKRNASLQSNLGNVVKASHGGTKNETLGSGDGTQAMQTFALKQPPLTFVAAPNPTGVNSTLQVYVNNVEWHEVDTLAGLEPKDRNFITKTDDKDVIFTSATVIAVLVMEYAKELVAVSSVTVHTGATL